MKKYKIITGVLIFVLIFLNLLYKIYIFNFKYKDKNENLRLDVSIQSIEQVTEDKVSYLVKYRNDKFILNIYNNKYSSNEKVDTSKYDVYKYGDILTLRGKISIPEKLGNPYEFDYKKYLNSKNIVGLITTYDVKPKDVKMSNFVLKFTYKLKDMISDNIKQKLPLNEYNLFKSMLYGEDNDLDQNIKDNFAKCGLSHLLAVSGSNIVALMLVLSYILKKINKENNIFIKAMVIFVFCIFSAFELSIIRASVMILISSIYSGKGKKLNIYKKILLSYIIILLYNPFYIFNIGLFMSYLAILGIVTFQNIIVSFLDINLKKILKILYKKPKGIKKALYDFVYVIIFSFSFTLSSLIFLFPIQIYYFNSFSLISFISNFLVSYIDNIFSIIGFCLLILSYIPYISDMLANVCFVILKFIIYITNTLVKLEILNIKIQTPGVICVIFYYIGFSLIISKKYILCKVKRKNQNIVKKYINILICGITIFIFFSHIYMKYFENYIIYFNVGQGNMSLIHYNRKNIVIDIGSTTENLANNILLNYLKRKNIGNIDLLIITHFHTDHINGINEELLSKVKVDKVIYTYPKENVKEYDEVIKCLEKYNVSKIVVNERENVTLDKIKFKFLSPNINNKIQDKDIMNSNSLVTLISIKNKNYLFMGDATKSTENYIIKNKILNIKDVEVLQVGHHGSDTSTSDIFLDLYNIKVGLISSKKKVYNHPSEKTLTRLKEHNISIKITEKNGAYKVKI